MTVAAGSPELPAGTFRIDRDGVWRHEGEEVTHPGVLENLYANLRVDDQGHYLQIGGRRVPVSVDDAPFVVSRLEAPSGRGDPADRLRIHLSDGTAEWLSPADFWVGARGVPYCRVKARRFGARLSIAAWLQLAPLVVEDETSGERTVELGGRRFPLAPPA